MYSMKSDLLFIENIEWNEINQTKKLTTTYQQIRQNGTYVVRIKDHVGNIGEKEIIINGIDTSIPKMTSIKIKTSLYAIKQGSFSDKSKSRCTALMQFSLGKFHHNGYKGSALTFLYTKGDRTSCDEDCRGNKEQRRYPCRNIMNIRRTHNIIDRFLSRSLCRRKPQRFTIGSNL